MEIKEQNAKISAENDQLRTVTDQLKTMIDQLKAEIADVKIKNRYLLFKRRRTDFVINSIRQNYVDETEENICPICQENMVPGPIQCSARHPNAELCSFCMCRIEADRDGDSLIIRCPICRNSMLEFEDSRLD